MNTMTRSAQAQRLNAELKAWVAAGGRENDAPCGPAAIPVLMFIGRTLAYRCAPSYREIQAACGLSSHCLASRAVKGLRDQGYVGSEPGIPRSIVLTRKGKDALRPIISPRKRVAA